MTENIKILRGYFNLAWSADAVFDVSIVSSLIKLNGTIFLLMALEKSLQNEVLHLLTLAIESLGICFNLMF